MLYICKHLVYNVKEIKAKHTGWFIKCFIFVNMVDAPGFKVSQGFRGLQPSQLQNNSGPNLEWQSLDRLENNTLTECTKPHCSHSSVISEEKCETRTSSLQQKRQIRATNWPPNRFCERVASEWNQEVKVQPMSTASVLKLFSFSSQQVRCTGFPCSVKKLYLS